jgi:hypothetical protein
MIRALSSLTAMLLTLPLAQASPGIERLKAHGHGPLTGGSPTTGEVVTPAEAAGVDFVPAPLVWLPPIDEATLVAEDELAEKGQPMRFSVQRSVDMSVHEGQWVPVPGGHVWRVDIQSAGAVNTRLHLTGLDLGDGQQLFLSVPGWTQATAGPLEGLGDFGNGEAWGRFGPGDTARIEWFVSGDALPEALPFESVECSHGYIDVFEFLPVPRLAAQCHNDPACYPAWSAVSNATARMSFTSGGGSYLCSGQLVATTAADETPYFATANHCISTQSEANSLNCLFFYRAGTCNGTATAGTTVAGSDLVRTYAPSDCTLLMLRGALPAGVAWVGWQNTNPANGTSSVGIHHPAGAEQDISFCVKAATEAFCGTGSNWSTVDWTLGITEGGSSGSGLYVESTQLMYGVLTCGESACTNLTGQDGYGRWDVAVNSGGFGTFLAAGSDDTQEPNDSCAAARLIAAGSLSGLVLKRLNEDWYAVDVEAGATLSVSATCTHANGDVDFQLFANCGDTTPIASDAGNVNNASLTWSNAGASTARVYLRAFLASDTRNDYAMNVALSGGGGGGGGGGAASVRISQVYGGGGSTSGGPTYNKDYVELFNAGDGPADIGGWTIEYGSATGNWGSNSSTIFTFPAGTVIQPCHHLLVASATGSAAGGTLPVTPDFTFTMAMSATNGKVGLFNAVNSNKACGSELAGTLVDKVAYGTANCAETTAVPALSVTSGAVRNEEGMADTDNNAADFTVVTAPVPHIAASPAASTCSAPPPPCPGDLDGSGVVDAGDIGSLLLLFGDCAGGTPGCTGDLDGSGAVDAGDIGSLLLLFGECPA